MKALTIRQPWAWAILNAGKTVENRSWRTDFRGTFAIHAAATMTLMEYHRFHDWYELFPAYSIGEVPHPVDLTLGAIIGTAEMTDCTTETEDDWWFGPPNVAFALANVKKLEKPIPYKGRLKFWDVPLDVEKQILEQIKI